MLEFSSAVLFTLSQYPEQRRTNYDPNRKTSKNIKQNPNASNIHVIILPEKNKKKNMNNPRHLWSHFLYVMQLMHTKYPFRF